MLPSMFLQDSPRRLAKDDYQNLDWLPGTLDKTILNVLEDIGTLLAFSE